MSLNALQLGKLPTRHRLRMRRQVPNVGRLDLAYGHSADYKVIPTDWWHVAPLVSYLAFTKFDNTDGRSDFE